MFSIGLTVRVFVLFALHFKNRCVNCVFTHIKPRGRQSPKKQQKTTTTKNLRILKELAFFLRFCVMVMSGKYCCRFSKADKHLDNTKIKFIFVLSKCEM